jgi:hypothetical protein
MNRLESCGTGRAIGGISLLFVGISASAWLVAVLGVGLIVWALYDVARLEKELNP